AGLPRGEAVEVRPKSGSPAVLAVVGVEEVEIGASGGEPPQVRPRLACPSDIGRVVGGLLPRRGDVEQPAGVAVAGGFAVLRMEPQRLAKLEEDDRAVR